MLTTGIDPVKLTQTLLRRFSFPIEQASERATTLILTRILHLQCVHFTIKL
jgi:hypothetical protein